MDEESARSLVRSGADIAGGAVGGALGFLAGGPPGAAVAGAGGVVIGELAYAILGDFAIRHLSRREQVRVGATAAFALESIRSRLDAGALPREDGFFDESSSGQTDAEQILEGVLPKAKNEHQEKKVRLLGEFFANLAFAHDVSAGEANHMLRLIETLSYMQICFIALLEKAELIPSIPLSDDEIEDPGLADHPELASLIQEIYDVVDLGLMFRRSDKLRGTWRFEKDRFVTPVSMGLSPLGHRLARMLELNSLSPEDIKVVGSLLHL